MCVLSCYGVWLGKTFTGAEKAFQLAAPVTLVICQKSKITDWIDHFRTYYKCHALNLTDKTGMVAFWEYQKLNAPLPIIGIINYELAWRRPELTALEGFTLMLDESSLIQNENAKRSKFILKLNFKNVILLSGTPVGGRYERLWSQCRLLGWNISKPMFYGQYVRYHYDTVNGFPQMIIDGYKNEERLKEKLRRHGAHFLAEDAFADLPEQIHQTHRIPQTREYKKFRKDRIITVNGVELVGDNVLTRMLYERQLCGIYNSEKLEAFADILESTPERVIVFYNFNAELDKLFQIVTDAGRHISVVNGSHKDLLSYEWDDSSVTFIQYQAGAMGLNLQKANRIVYFTPPLSSELFEQSKKRIHRIGQKRTCFYHYLTVTGSVEERIYAVLSMRKDYTERLFEHEEED